MIHFDLTQYRHTKTGEVILSYDEIEEFTEQILKEYKPEALTTPQALDCDDFIEGYLGAIVDYQDIYTRTAEETILGCAIFSEQPLAVFDRERMCKSEILCAPKTVVLDNSLLGKRQVQHNCTGFHEGGHLVIHPYLFLPYEHQQTLHFYLEQNICCRRSGIETMNASTPLVTAEQWREWQATTFAVTLALNRHGLKIATLDLFRKHGIWSDQLITDEDDEKRHLADHTIPEELHNIFDMSKEAIRYRLEKVGLYTTQKKFDWKNAQLGLPF